LRGDPFFGLCGSRRDHQVLGAPRFRGQLQTSCLHEEISKKSNCKPSAILLSAIGKQDAHELQTKDCNWQSAVCSVTSGNQTANIMLTP
jgi:hypothetical protein